MDSEHNKPVVVLGAGPAGLGAGYWLAKAGRKVIVLEKAPHVGGMGASIRVKDYIADYGPHTFHLKKSAVTALFEQLAGPEVTKVHRNAKIWIDGKMLPFPLRASDALTKLGPALSCRITLDYLAQNFRRCISFNGSSTPRSFEDW